MNQDVASLVVRWVLSTISMTGNRKLKGYNVDLATALSYTQYQYWSSLSNSIIYDYDDLSYDQRAAINMAALAWLYSAGSDKSIRSEVYEQVSLAVSETKREEP